MKPSFTGPRAGSLLVEALIALVVLVTAVLAFSRTAMASMQQQRSIAERALATTSAQEVLENLMDLPVEEVFARYNANLGDNPVSGIAPGPGFSAGHLQAAEDDPDGLPGQILFPVGVTPAGELELREDLEALRFGLPFDLNGDGQITAASVAEDYRLLPVVVRVRWRSVSSVQEVELRTWLGSAFDGPTTAFVPEGAGAGNTGSQGDSAAGDQEL